MDDANYHSICREPGCPTIIAGRGYCEAHRAAAAHRASKPWVHLYNDKSWRGPNGLRRWKLLRFPLCANPWTLAGHDAVPAEDVDHVVPHNGNLKLFYDRENLMSLCHACHSRKTAAASGFTVS